MNTAAFRSKAVILQANKERICCIYIIMYKLNSMKAMYKSELAAYAGVSTGNTEEMADAVPTATE